MEHVIYKKEENEGGEDIKLLYDAVTKRLA